MKLPHKKEKNLSSIVGMVKMSSVSLHYLDPFYDIHPISGGLTAFSMINLQFPGAGDDNVNERYKSDYKNKHFLDEEANAFDLFANM